MIKTEKTPDRKRTFEKSPVNERLASLEKDALKQRVKVIKLQRELIRP